MCGSRWNPSHVCLSGEPSHRLAAKAGPMQFGRRYEPTLLSRGHTPEKSPLRHLPAGRTEQTEAAHPHRHDCGKSMDVSGRNHNTQIYLDRSDENVWQRLSTFNFNDGEMNIKKLLVAVSSRVRSCDKPKINCKL